MMMVPDNHTHRLQRRMDESEKGLISEFILKGLISELLFFFNIMPN